VSILDLPPTPATAAPVIVPGLLSGRGVTPRRVPAWVTDPNAIKSIALGLIEIDDEFMARDEPTLKQIRRRIDGWLCFYLAVQRARIAELEQRITAAGHPLPPWSNP
jgi:hypothetical protein